MKLYQKLIQTCKYFFLKNPILIYHCLSFDDEDGWKVCGNTDAQTTELNFDFTKTSSKVWITECLEIISDKNPNLASSFLQEKLFRHEITNNGCINFYKQTIFFNDLFPRYSTIKTVNLPHVSVICEDGTVASVEKILTNFPNVKKFYYKNDTVTYSPNLVENLLKIPHFLNITHFRLDSLSDTFNIEKFYEFVKKTDGMIVILNFAETISEEYQNRLEAIVDEILESYENNNSVIQYKPIFMKFPGLDEFKIDMLADCIKTTTGFFSWF
uniref:DUF38 domain-containing protein n=1 Tax=Panagrolaimus sp. PS1159 TaxID=55785 RepID=A0AC35F177_9BILA